MKILVWCSVVSIGGGNRLLANLLPAMAEDAEVENISVVISSSSGLKDRIPPSRQSKLQIIYVDGRVITPLQDLAREFDIVYCFWPHGLQYQPAGKPMVCTFHDTTVFDYHNLFFSGSTMQQAWTQCKSWLENCSTVIVPSNHVKSRLAVIFGEKCAKTVVIPHAISPISTFTGGSLSPQLAGRLPAEYIIYPANTCPHKNHNNLLVAYANFTRRKQYPLVLCGYATEQLGWESSLDSSDLSLSEILFIIKLFRFQVNEDFFPLGFVSDNDVSLLIKNAKALIMPSLSEGGGSYPVEEALTMGTPVLCSNIPVMREHLTNRTAKIVWFDPQSPMGIAQALEEMLLNYDEYKESAVNCRNDTRPLWHDIAKDYIQVFKALFHNAN